MWTSNNIFKQATTSKWNKTEEPAVRLHNLELEKKEYSNVLNCRHLDNFHTQAQYCIIWKSLGNDLIILWRL